jgi:hypothetical protein
MIERPVKSTLKCTVGVARLRWNSKPEKLASSASSNQSSTTPLIISK